MRCNMVFTFKEGDLKDLQIAVNIHNDCGFSDMKFHLSSKDIDICKTVRLKKNEISDLLSTLVRFDDRKMNEGCLWDFNTSGFEIFLNPDADMAEIRLFFDPPYSHMSGVFFQMHEKKQYEPFIEFLKNGFASSVEQQTE